MIEFSGPCKNEADYKQLTGQSCEDALSLTGAGAFYNYAELCECVEECVLIATDYFPSVTIQIDYGGMNLQRTIDYSKKYVRNDDFRLTRHQTGKGTAIFVNQVLTAERLGFMLLAVSAMGGAGYTFFNGHVTWAKMGYLLTGVSLEKYRDRLSELGIDYMPLHLFLQAKNIKCKNGEEIPCGHTYWTTPGNGFPWDGTFDTRKGSENRRILFGYAKPKIKDLEKMLVKCRHDYKNVEEGKAEKMAKELKDREAAFNYLVANVDLLN